MTNFFLHHSSIIPKKKKTERPAPAPPPILANYGILDESSSTAAIGNGTQANGYANGRGILLNGGGIVNNAYAQDMCVVLQLS